MVVLAIVRPDKRVLCADEITLQDERDKVLAVARALKRGYLQAQLEPEEAVAAMTRGRPVPRSRAAVARSLTTRSATWTAGATYFGELAPAARARPEHRAGTPRRSRFTDS